MTSTRAKLIAFLMMLSVTSVQAQQGGNDKLFFNGNDVYAWCKTDRVAVLAYTAGLADEATHSAYVVNIIVRGPPTEQGSRADHVISADHVINMV
jgi:hypothetical protein